MRLHILYTAYLRANFDLMPRVFTLIQQVRRRFTPEATLLLDLGNAWSAESWVCQVTNNRAPYLILDAMGYNVVRADGLSAEGIMGLQEATQVRLIGEQGYERWAKGEMVVNIGSNIKVPGIDWAATATMGSETEMAVVASGRLILTPLAATLGYVVVHWPDLTIIEGRRFAFNFKGRPDPTIISAIEFVEREAQYYAQKNKGRMNNETH